MRDNMVHGMYREEMSKLGEAGMYVSKEYLYRKVGERLHRGEVFFQLGVSNVRAAQLGGAVLAQYFFSPCL